MLTDSKRCVFENFTEADKYCEIFVRYQHFDEIYEKLSNISWIGSKSDFLKLQIKCNFFTNTIVDTWLVYIFWHNLHKLNTTVLHAKQVKILYMCVVVWL